MCLMESLLPPPSNFSWALSWIPLGTTVRPRPNVELFMRRTKLRACLLGGRGSRVGEATRCGLPHLSCKCDQIKMRDYMDRRVTPPKRVTSPTWGPPPPCKQALKYSELSSWKERRLAQLSSSEWVWIVRTRSIRQLQTRERTAEDHLRHKRRFSHATI